MVSLSRKLVLHPMQDLAYIYWLSTRETEGQGQITEATEDHCLAAEDDRSETFSDVEPNHDYQEHSSPLFYFG